MIKSLDQFFQWETATRDTIDVKKIYVDMADDLIAGVLLSQIVFWFLPNKDGKTKLRVKKDNHLWLVKGREDWWEECRIKPRQYDTALKKLEEKGLVTKKTMKFNGNPTTHIRIVWEKFLPVLYEELSKIETVNPLLQNGENHDTSGSNKSVKTKSHEKNVDNTSSNKSVKTKSQNGEIVLPKSVKTLTEITTEIDDDDDDINKQDSIFIQELRYEANDYFLSEKKIQEIIEHIGDKKFNIKAIPGTFAKVMEQYRLGKVSKFGKYFVTVLEDENERINNIIRSRIAEKEKIKQLKAEYGDIELYNWLEGEEPQNTAI